MHTRKKICTRAKNIHTQKNSMQKHLGIKKSQPMKNFSFEIFLKVQVSRDFDHVIMGI